MYQQTERWKALQQLSEESNFDLAVSGWPCGAKVKCVKTLKNAMMLDTPFCCALISLAAVINLMNTIAQLGAQRQTHDQLRT